ncbi:MAG: ATP synthase subunit I [Clostridiales Family XIII bacterium]|jgi:hypothetical protein|nr:ATP synthase subunit I [Clostridiales Family XIII bacterium]
MQNGVREITAFKNRIFIYGILTAVIFEAGSLFFLGFSRDFAYGLALGTAIAIVNFNILAFTLQRVIANGKKWLMLASYLLRLCIYGFAFYMAATISLVSAAGTALGFVTLKIAIYYLHGFKAKFSKGRKARPEPEGKKGSRLDFLRWQEDSADEAGGADEAGAPEAPGEAGAEADEAGGTGAEADEAGAEADEAGAPEAPGGADRSEGGGAEAGGAEGPGDGGAEDDEGGR